jgi:hypothetical protein
MFQGLIKEINKQIVNTIFHINTQAKQPPQQQSKLSNLVQLLLLELHPHPRKLILSLKELAGTRFVLAVAVRSLKNVMVKIINFKI